MYEAELQIVLLNVFTNALKAVREQPAAERRIMVTGEQEERHTYVRMHDTGPGIQPAARTRAFEPFYTTSSPDPVLGVGTGLGLSIVQDILEQYGGEARFVDADPPYSTCIEVKLPLRS